MINLFLGLVIGFVVGILFGRRNKKKVEMALEEVKARYENLLDEIRR